MILRPRSMGLTFFLLFLLSIPVTVVSEASFDCQFQANGFKYDLETLGDEHTAVRERETPPTQMVDSVRISLCSDLKRLEGSETDQCPPGTRVCLTKINKKADSTDRIFAVIPIAQSPDLNPTYSKLSSPQGLSILLHGGSYPHPINATNTQQSVNITLLCDPNGSVGDPEFVSYDGAQLDLKWSVPAACGFAGDDDQKEGDSPGKGESGSGSLSSVGWFLLLLLVAFATYMGLGAYYNYSTYGASGIDLIPHRDFWMEVPYMLRDVASHLCSSVRPRRSSNRGGYIAV
ncbi:autophagy-related protein 27 [Mycena capillaripes]|nr:autophagy-related protein 27 [Mycena capillaripes]